MASCTRTLFILAAIVALFAYFIYQPLPPEDFSQPWRLRMELAATNFFDRVAMFAEATGYGYSKASGNIARTLLSIIPVSDDKSVQSRDSIFDGVPVRIYEPVRKEENSRAVVFFHGGGFIIGDLDMYHSQVYRLSKELNAVVISVAYRTGPEHVFPKAVDDCEAAIKYFLQHVSDYGVDPNRVAVMGESAGGNLATSISRRLSKQKFTPLPKLQVLLYPSTQMVNNDLPSYRYNQYGPIATKVQASYFTSWYVLGDLRYRNIILNNSHVSTQYRDSIKHLMDIDLLPDDEIKRSYHAKNYHDSHIWQDIKDKFQSPDLCPLLADEEDLRLLPPAYISTCQYDILRDEEMFYIARLKKAGVKVIHDHLHVCVHGWTFLHEGSFNKDFSDMVARVDENL